MDIENIVAELRREKDRIERAIASLIESNEPRRRGRPPGKTMATKGPKVMSPAARKRISEAMKQRWAEKRKRSS
jgi:hypothetical protein